MAAHERGLNVMGKPVFLLLNGDSYTKKRLVVNQRQMPNFDCLLDAAAKRFHMPAREIRTPGGRHRIRKLDDLQRDCSYVVVGNEPFKKIEYDGKGLKPPRFGTVKLPDINFVQLNHRKFGGIPGRAQISGLRKKEETKTIIVFCNGLVLKPKRVQLKTDYKMFQVLEAVNDKVSPVSKYGAVFDLFTTDGRFKILEPSQLEDNGQYVAVGRERFFDRSVPYDDQGVTSQLTPRRASTRPKAIDARPARKRRHASKRSTKKKSLIPDESVASELAAAALVASKDEPEDATPESLMEAEPVRQFENLESSRDEGFIPDRIEEPLRAFVGHFRQDSEEEEEPPKQDTPVDESIMDKVTDFLGDHGIPLGELIDNKQDNSVEDVDDKDQGDRTSQGRSSRNEESQAEVYEVKPSVYQASGEDREDAREIVDDKETVEDKPVDQMAAEEVADEEVADEDIDESAIENRDADDEVSNRGPEEEPFSDTKPENSEPIPPKENETNEAQ
ncbi:doublecortin domain-containing protein 2-like isoform X2 [Montipora foliosa]|uniref:doublecortin domain-containing protein 2-like isoform X2 n=1 Tax=Montipora foliosa TaxID=591990 RepID=UPI0035F1B01A